VILPLDNEGAREPRVAGGKASTLARLRAAGFPVPDGFVITPDEDVVLTLAEALGALRRRVGDDVRFAVRSSGIAEDSSDASFAGQYESVLGVRSAVDVAQAIERCFVSFSNDRALAYYAGRGVRDAGGAVLVQQLVEADAAGVAFTVDPVTGARDRVTIDAAPGLGEAVVGGRVVPDAFAVLTSGAIVHRRLTGARASLGDDAVRAVAALARRVEAHEGRPVDIEWAWHGGQVHLLQARPITAIAAPPGPPEDWVPELNTAIDPRFPLYSNGNVSEILPGCVTPLTFSLFARVVERAFRDLPERVGSMTDVGPRPVVVGFFFHRLYLNASYFMTAADRSPGASPDHVYEELIGRPPVRHPAWKWSDLLPWNLWRGAWIIGRFLALQRQLPRDIAACRTLLDDRRRQFAQKDPTQWSADELASSIVLAESASLPAIVHIRASQFANTSFGTLQSLTRRWLDDATGTVASSLVTGIGWLAGASPAVDLSEMGRFVAREPALVAGFRDQPDDERLLAQIQAAERGPWADLRSRLRDFIGRYGHRGFREAEYRSPSWGERPATVLTHLRTHLTPGQASISEIAVRQQRISDEARTRALARLDGLERALFTPVLEAARKHIAAREQMKDLLMQFVALQRRVIAAAKLRLADLLEQGDDIYFLLDREVAAALRGEQRREALQAIVKRRRQEFAWCERLQVPKVQDGTARASSVMEPPPSEDDLSGLSVSPGIVEGPARIVFDPAEASIDAGDILVAPVTDVAWTPLFLHAKGLVVEVGGLLSHGSIVAREYGIPAVTAVAGATRRIRSGDRVRVDANRGVVAILPASGDADQRPA
jgi:pyruvate,water dikinase